VIHRGRYLIGFMGGFFIGAAIGIFTLGFLTAAREQDSGGTGGGAGKTVPIVKDGAFRVK
jgi:hypothetical protein